MYAATAVTYERGALIKIINDLESALNAARGRTDRFAQLVSLRLEEALDQRKKELVSLERNRLPR